MGGKKQGMEKNAGKKRYRQGKKVNQRHLIVKKQDEIECS